MSNTHFTTPAPIGPAEPLTAEQQAARDAGYTAVTLRIYLQNPAMAAAVQLEAEQAANLFNTLPQAPLDAPGGDGEPALIADTAPDQADALDTRQCLYGSGRHETP